jgi:hypothetical protein
MAVTKFIMPLKVTSKAMARVSVETISSLSKTASIPSPMHGTTMSILTMMVSHIVSQMFHSCILRILMTIFRVLGFLGIHRL